MFKKILVPTDGSEPSAKAQTVAIQMAKSFGVPVVGIYVIEPLPYVGLAEIGVPDLSEYTDAARAEGKKALDAVDAQCSAQGVQFEGILTESPNVDQGILTQAAAHGCDLIVMGTHGRRGLNRLLMGSVARSVLSESKVPVLVVP